METKLNAMWEIASNAMFLIAINAKYALLDGL